MIAFLALAWLPLAQSCPAEPELPSFDAAALDRSASPCQDFYRFACGGWAKAHPMPPDQPAWDRFHELAERNRQALRGILEAAASGPKTDPVDQRLGDLYDACMDESAADRKGLEPLRADLSAIAALSSPAELPALLARLHAEGVSAGFSFDSGQDYRDATRVIAQLDQGGLGLPDRSSYLDDDEESAQLRRDYLWHLAKVFGFLEDDPSTAATEAGAVLRLETALARASQDRVTRRDPDNIYHRMSLAGLSALAPGFDWDRYLRQTGAPASPWINVVSPGFAAGFATQAVTRAPADWKAYLRWRVAAGAAPWLSREFVEEEFDFSGRKLAGAQTPSPRWKRCVELADGALGHDLGRRYAQAAFAAEDKRRAEELVSALRRALGREIAGRAWMSDATKRQALRKLAGLGAKIGSPRRWRDYAGVRIDRDDLLGSLRSARAYETRRRLGKIGRPVDREDWGLTPPAVRAYYDPQLNEIVFPAGLLQPPVFDRSGDLAWNLGAVGALIGHELVHGFDDEGGRFDAQGNLSGWWTSEETAQFKSRASCLAEQYGGAPGSAALTLGEDVADNGGLHLATIALREFQKTGAVRPDIAGLTPEQRLYLGFTQLWCAKLPGQDARQPGQIDRHSTTRWRALGPLSNTPEFGQAFSCRFGEAMRPARTCQAW